jgi:hypothetical protein
MLQYNVQSNLSVKRSPPFALQIWTTLLPALQKEEKLIRVFNVHFVTLSFELALRAHMDKGVDGGLRSIGLAHLHRPLHAAAWARACRGRHGLISQARKSFIDQFYGRHALQHRALAVFRTAGLQPCN